MTFETMLKTLSYEENLAAMDLLWQELSATPTDSPSPEWHGEVIADRLKNPAPGTSLSLEESQVEVNEAIDSKSVCND